MVAICLSLVGVGLVISVPVSAWLCGASVRWGLLDAADREAHKREGAAVPNTGGVAIFAAVALPLAAVLVSVWLAPVEFWRAYLPRVWPHVSGLRAMTGVGGGVLSAMCVLHLLGLVDDRRGLGPFMKLGVQAAVAAGLVVLCDMRVLMLPTDHGFWPGAWSVVVSVAWLVVIINAMNFLDNMDGLAAGVGLIIAGIYLAQTLIGGQWFVAGLSAVLAGALLGFLVFNYPPARMYMGDGGSLVVGLVLGVISVRTTYVEPGAAAWPGGRWYAVLTPLMVMAIPLYDFTSVTVIRLWSGRSPFRGDLNHFSHRLVRLGMSRRRAVVLVCLCTVATGLSGVMLPTLAPWQAWVAAGQTATVLALLGLLERGAAKP